MASQYVKTRLAQIEAAEAARLEQATRPQAIARPRYAPARGISKRAAYRFRALVKRFDLSPEGYDDLLAAQEGRCAGCRRPIVSGAPCVFADRPGARPGAGRLVLIEGRAGLVCGRCRSLRGLLDKGTAV